MGPSQRCEKTPVLQDGSWRLGRRICLLKGCERTFQPRHPLSRYCSEACRAAARRWHRQQANRRYRASEQGKCRRRDQACRYREAARIVNQRMSRLVNSTRAIPSPVGRRHTLVAAPAATRRFVKTRRSPLQKFCSAACRQALRRVLIRERRWQRRLAHLRRVRCPDDAFW